MWYFKMKHIVKKQGIWIEEMYMGLITFGGSFVAFGATPLIERTAKWSNCDDDSCYLRP